MTEEARSHLRDAHVEQEQPRYMGRPRRGTQCRLDQQAWPCDAIREADRADRLEKALTAIRGDIGWLAKTTCDCAPDWTERGRHQPLGGCLFDELRMSDEARAALAASSEGEGSERKPEAWEIEAMIDNGEGGSNG